MRVATVICCMLLLCSHSPAQDTRQEDDAYSLRLVQESVKDPVLALGVSFTEKRINRLGDRVSVALLKIYDAGALKEPENVRHYLPIVRAAFVAPRVVSIVEDRKPKVTMFLLTYLEAEVRDASLRTQISEAIRYIKRQTVER